MDFNSLTPYIRTALNSRFHGVWELKERVIFDYEIIFVKEGKICITIDGVKHIGTPNDIFLIKPKQTHDMKVLENMPVWLPHAHFDFFYQENSPQVKVSFRDLSQMSEADMLLFREDITSGPDLFIPNKITVSNTAYVDSMIMSIIWEHSHPDHIHMLAAKGILLTLLSYILHEQEWQSGQQRSVGKAMMENVGNYIHQNADKQIDLDMLSTVFSVNKYHLCRAFCKIYGVSPIKYHKILQVKNAQELIRSTSLSLTQIAEQTGSDSIQSFSRMFKRITGMSPLDYRMANQDR